jgi:hypothetical protein
MLGMGESDKREEEEEALVGEIGEVQKEGELGRRRRENEEKRRKRWTLGELDDVKRVKGVVLQRGRTGAT